MRKLPLGVAVSVALHAAAVAWVGTHAFPERPREAESATTPIEVISIDAAAPPEPAIAPAAIDVALPDPLPPTAPTAPTSPSRSRAHAPTGSIVVPGPGSAAETAPQTPARSPWLAMRRGEAPRLALPGGRWDLVDRVPEGTRPEKDRTTGILHDAGRGTYESDQGGFTGKVRPDGTVKLHDKPSASIHIALPSPKDLGRSLAQWYEAEKGTYGETTDMPMSKQIQLSAGTTTDPGDAAYPEHMLKDGAKTVIVPVFGGGLEVTDWLMRRKGIDPYASRKLKLLDATRDERVQIGNRHRAEQLALTPQIVRRNLDRLWAATRDMAARKQALFELWDECVESGDPAIVAGGQAARRLVIGFIRAHLPAGSSSAYTPAELAELARTQQSKTAFAPYE
jgi:hypothetical protein